MFKYITIFFVFIVSINSIAADAVRLTPDSYDLSSHASSPADFVPSGWKVIRQTSGSLQNDNSTGKTADVVMIIEQNNPNNIVKHDGFGESELNLNPRWLLVLLHSDSGYKLHTLSKNFIPSENDAVSPCLMDPLAEAEDPYIKNQKLYINFHYWLSCGSYEMGNHHLQFKLKGEQFKLIGLDTWYLHRASGEITQSSINYLTSKKKYTYGENAFEDHVKPKMTWYDLPKRPLLNLSTLTFEQYSDDYQNPVATFD